jgi:hypothetical protein
MSFYSGAKHIEVTPASCSDASEATGTNKKRDISTKTNQKQTI